MPFENFILNYFIGRFLTDFIYMTFNIVYTFLLFKAFHSIIFFFFCSVSDCKCDMLALFFSDTVNVNIFDLHSCLKQRSVKSPFFTKTATTITSNNNNNNSYIKYIGLCFVRQENIHSEHSLQEFDSNKY